MGCACIPATGQRIGRAAVHLLNGHAWSEPCLSEKPLHTETHLERFRDSTSPHTWKQRPLLACKDGYNGKNASIYQGCSAEKPLIAHPDPIPKVAWPC